MLSTISSIILFPTTDYNPNTNAIYQAYFTGNKHYAKAIS